MIVNLNDKESTGSKAHKAYDVCIIGAGAAGISICKILQNLQLQVALVESGDFTPSPETQELYSGTSHGALPEQYLSATRLRYFGGTTNHWSGLTRPLSKVDFLQKFWDQNSGWPINLNELNPFYTQAEELCQINSFSEVDQQIKKLQPQYFFDSELFDEKCFQFSPPTRFGKVYRKLITEASNIDLWINSNLTQFSYFNETERIKEINVSSLSGNTKTIRAKYFVLACGGLENPRILLFDQTRNPNRIKNKCIGHYFMEHPHTQRHVHWVHHFKKQELAFYERRAQLELGLPKNTTLMNVLMPKYKIMKQHKTLNFFVELFLNTSNSKPKPKPALAAQYFSGKLKPFINTSRVIIRSEQQALYKNMARLTNDLDRFGTPKLRLDSQHSELDIHTIRVAFDLVARLCGARNLGRLYIENENFKDSDWGNHHMGTTRMGTSPEKSVVNSNCKVHGIENLYVAGSSLFTTSGAANPTLTICALAVRLGHHLRSTLAHEKEV